jgi:hypothetical protein
MDRQRRNAIVTGIILAAIALAIYLFTIFKYIA